MTTSFRIPLRPSAMWKGVILPGVVRHTKSATLTPSPEVVMLYTHIAYTEGSRLFNWKTCGDTPRKVFADGNQTLIQTSTGIWQIQYNGENRPINWERITSNSSTPTLISMSFDRMVRRVQYLETCGSVTNSNKAFTYDGYLQIANFDSATQNAQRFIWDPTEPIATRPLVWNFSTFQPFNTSTSYYTHDMRPRRRRRVARRSVATEPRSGRKRPRNKNVSDLVASSNLSVAAHYEYAPFGVIIKQYGNNAAANRLRFSCEFAEDSTLTIYYNYRHCVAEVGRWIHREKCPRNP